MNRQGAKRWLASVTKSLIKWIGEKWGKARSWTVETFPWMTFKLIVAVVYAILVVGVAFLLIRPERHEAHYVAVRYMDKNTRLSPMHLVPPAAVPPEEIFRLQQEKDVLEGSYLLHPVQAGGVVSAEDVRSWPDIKPDEVVPFELDTEPDLMLLNRGATVEIWVGDAKVPVRAQVLAIVPSGRRWQVLLRKSDLKEESLGGPKDQRTLRISALP